MSKILAVFALLLAATVQAQTPAPIDFPIWALRAPRYGDGLNAGDRQTKIPEVDGPTNCEPGTDLVLLKPDGEDEILVESGEFGAVLDPKLSLDGKWVYYSLIEDARHTPVNDASRFLTQTGSDIYRINVQTRAKERITHGDAEWTPNRGVIPWSQLPSKLDAGKTWPEQEFLTHGIYNLGSQPLPGGRVTFVSSRNALAPNGGRTTTYPNLQRFIMDDDGKNVEQVGYMDLMSVLHPTLMTNGKLLTSRNEGQGHRVGINWSTWLEDPDEREWEPQIFSSGGGGSPSGFHWQAQWPDGDRCTIQYYANNNGGFGRLVTYPEAPSPLPGIKAFGHPQASLNPPISPLFHDFLPFQIYGLYSSTPWAPSADIIGTQGKVSMPSAAPGNRMLVCYSKAPAHLSGSPTPFIQSEIRIMNSKLATSSAELEVIKADPKYNYLQPLAIVPYAVIYGKTPPIIPECPDNTSDAMLPPGTPFGLVGTSSLWTPESWDANGGGQNFVSQGANSTPGGAKFPDGSIAKIRIVRQVPTSATRGARHFTATGKERLQVVGEVDVRKAAGVLDSNGHPDTSFLCRILADESFTFQALGEDGLAWAFAPTWHQLRPGERRDGCAGCHNHHNPEPDFKGTAASLASYQIPDLTKNKPWTKEWKRDVLPIMQEKCVSCHSQGGDAPVIDANFPIGDGGKDRADQYAYGYNARQSTMYTKMAEGHGEATPEEALTVGQWIDLGMQTDYGHAYGIFADDQKPTLFLQSPRRVQVGPLTELRFGAFDWMGIKSASVKADFAVNGKAAGAELADLFTEADSIRTLKLSAPFTGSGKLTVIVTDGTGITQKIERTFATTTAPEPPPRVPAGQYLGMDSDELGELRSKTPDGKPDHHIRLTGLNDKRPIVFIDIKAGTDADQTATWHKWSTDAGEESPAHPQGLWWWIKQTPRIADGPTGALDVWFSKAAPDQNFNEYRVYVMYSRTDLTDRDFIRVPATITPPPSPDQCEARIAELEAALAASNITISEKQALVTELEALVQRKNELIQQAHDAK